MPKYIHFFNFVKYIVNNGFTLYDSDCATKTNKTVQTVFEHYLFLNLTIQATRDCVGRSMFVFQLFGIEEIILLTSADLDQYIFSYFVSIEVFTLILYYVGTQIV